MSPASKALYDFGTFLYTIGDYSAAIVGLEAGLELDPHPDFEYGLGQAYRLLGDCPHAVAHYRAFLATRPPDSEVARTRLNLARCAGLAEPDFTGAPGAQPLPPPPTPAPIDRSSWYTDLPGGVLAGAGLVGIVVGLTYFVKANNNVDLANLADTILDYQQHAEGIHHDRVVGAVALSAGAVLAGLAVIRYVSVARRTPDIGVAITPTGGSVQWTARF